jgi:hypothetical protein
MPMNPLGFHLNPSTNPWVQKLTQTHTLIEQKPTGFRVAGTHCHLGLVWKHRFTKGFYFSLFMHTYIYIVELFLARKIGSTICVPIYEYLMMTKWRV